MLDVGLIRLPDDAQNAIGLGPDENTPKFIPLEMGSSEGTVVYWCGFPGVVEKYLGRSHLCLFRGVVCSMIDGPDRPRYLIDGHITRGVSGGPMWTWSKTREQTEYVGLVSGYGLIDGTMPGFCVMEPINNVLGYMHNWNAEVLKSRHGQGA
jgi:hypothetical protein